MHTYFRLTSPETPYYNCIAWAAGDDSAWWWPDEDYYCYWPSGIPREESLDAFIEAYRTLGYEPCSGDDIEEGCEKIAIYVKNGKPKHAARQLPNGNWTSKLGQENDIEHTLVGVECFTYGTVGQIMKRRKKD